MAGLEKEGCPVCWREYGVETVPTSIACGHSFCAECLVNLRACPLCRKRITSATPRTTNYSLLSLANRVNAVQSAASQSGAGTEKPIKFKFARHPTGGLRSLEVMLG